MLYDLLNTLGTLSPLQVIGAAAGVGVAVVTATAGVSAWIDNATEGPEGPVRPTDYDTVETLPVACSYYDSGCQEAATAQVAGWELCSSHADEIVGRSTLDRVSARQ